jgi:serine/threonine protein kinase
LIVSSLFEDGEHIFLVQEACLGGELFDLVIERKHFTEGDAARACQTLISIISHCHARGVLHRDIKPENFLLKSILGSEEGRFDGSDVRAVDFGLSIFTKDRFNVTDIVGSSYYIAPEILAGEHYSPAADAWSLGVVVFILISGYPPFWGSSDPVIYDRIQNQELDLAYEPWTTDAVSLEAADFVKKLLNKDPEQRMTLAEAAQHPWLVKAATCGEDGNASETGNTNKCLSAPLGTAIVERLRAFTRENRLTCLLMTLVAHHLSDTAIGELRRTFYSLDTDEDGLIGVADITKALQTTVASTTTKNTDSNASASPNEQGIAELVAQLNEAVSVGAYMKDNSHHHIGQVNVDEFLAAALDRKKVLTKRTVSAVFNRLDQNNEGKLNMTILSSALAECGIPVPESTLRSMLAREGALDGAGVVSARSFQNLLVAGAEEHQNRATAVALERILSGDLDNGGFDTLENTESDIDESSGALLDQEKPLKPSQNLKLITKTTCRPLKVSISAPQRSLATSSGLASDTPRERSTGATLDEVLKQYGASSGYRTPRRNRKGGSASASASASPSPMKGAGLIPGEEVKRVESKGSTPESVASPSIACLGWD